MPKKQMPGPVVRELSVGDVAERSGVAVSTLHFYEMKGLIRSERNRGNQRRYKRSVLRRVAVIKVAQRTGIPLSDIKEALDVLPHDRPLTAGDWRRLSETWRRELDERIHRLTALRDHLDGCIGCGCLSMQDCPLRNPQDVLAGEGAGAHLLEEWPLLCRHSRPCAENLQPIDSMMTEQVLGTRPRTTSSAD